MKFSKNYLALIALLSLSACGYAANSSKQYVTFLAPNTENAICDVFIDLKHYKVHPPHKIKIYRSESDMRIECAAQGSPAVEMNVAAQYQNKALWGQSSGGAWNYDRESFYAYPEIINIEFPQSVSKDTDLSNPVTDIESEDVQNNTIEGVIESLASDKAQNDAAEDQPVSVVPGQ